MAQDDFLEFVERVKQAESRGQRYGKDGKLLTSPKGAQGEMQVMPATQRRPGFGITPIRDESPEEIARVGRDLLKALDGYYGGNKMYAAAAYNWGKSNVDKWIAKGADFNKLPQETQGYLRRIKPETLSSMTARSAPPAAQEVGPAVMEPPLGVSASAAPARSATPATPAVAPTAVAAAPAARAEDLGSGYKAALALSFLNDDDRDRPTTDSELEDRLNETALAEFNKELEDYTPKNALQDLEITALNPIKAMQPVKMATGGEVGARAMLDKMFPVSRAGGGEAEPTAEELDAASRPYFGNPNIARQGAAARNLAERRDVNTLPDPRTYAAVSGFLGQAPDQLGFSVMHPDLQGIKRAGEVGFAAGLVPAVAPVVAPVAKAVGKAATALGMRTEKALEAPVTRTLERGGRSAEMLQALGAQPSFAVKPRGGSSLSSGDISAPPISKLDETLRTYADAMKLEMAGTDPKIIDNFVDKKVRKYITSSFGTSGDPIRRAISTGEFQMFGKEAESAGGITPYLLQAARDPSIPGHEMAKRHLESLYDQYTNINSRIISTAPAADADVSSGLRAAGASFQKKNRDLMTQEGVPDEFQNALPPDLIRSETVARYPNLYGPYAKAIEQSGQGTLPPQAAYIMEKSLPFFDFPLPSATIFNPFEVAKTIATLPANKLANMSFEQAFLEGSKNMRVFRDYSVAVDRADKGLSVPKEVLSMFTRPVLGTDKGQWVKLTNPEATRLEGALMHHSVGGYARKGGYNHGGREGFLSGEAQVFSLRDKKTELPFVTIEAKKTGDDLEITQIKGPFNSAPMLYGEDVFRFLDKNPRIKKVSSEYYNKDNTGQPLSNNIAIDWGKSFDNWKANNGAGEWVLQPNSFSGLDNYIWGAPVTKARGGMVERRNNDNRAYL